MWELGEQNRDNPFLREVSGRRGSPDSVYVNRTYFGLYSLLSRLGAKVKTRGRLQRLSSRPFTLVLHQIA
jgi:hypothetical protein